MLLMTVRAPYDLSLIIIMWNENMRVYLVGAGLNSNAFLV